MVQVRENITNLVGDAAEEIAMSVIDVAMNGQLAAAQLASAKYLYEMAGLYPATEETGGKPGEDSLARTLLDRIGPPTKPVVDAEDAPASMKDTDEADAAAPKKASADAGEDPEVEQGGEGGAAEAENAEESEDEASE